MQLTHYNSRFNQQTFPITLICENVTNAANIGSLFRTADAFGIEKLILCGSPVPFGRKMAQTSRATEKYVNFEWNENAEEILVNFKSLGYQILALEITDNSTSLFSMELNADQPIVLLIGDENFGISEACLELSDRTIHIEMFGQNSSMNVVQATNIALYEITKQLRKIVL
ncbi:TrmH family RNA methyltransferase [Gelidibacter pelagius]|uniref:TrmH family RNA methyltransferase n=1 Tax=Gelidibacter pelagius TaxID=2819985 RepID=A0ABS3SQG5_9FLAO|nr:TrmH family RNA methyltransferase [Gelidibacter pelagius]MBO3097952.1 TrmH family RNA methyltransferase [Gelidibacter pelagius]